MILNVLVLMFTIFLYVFYRSCWEKRILKNWIRILIEVLFLAVIFPIGVNIVSISPMFRSREQLEAERKVEEFQGKVLEGIADRNLDTKDLHEILKEKYKSVYKANELDAEKWAKNFAERISQKKGEIESIRVKEQELATKLDLKWRLYVEYLIKVFDDKIAVLEKYKNVVKSENSFNVVLAGDSSGAIEVRRIALPNKSEIICQLIPGKVENGELSETPYFELQMGGEGRRVTVFQIRFKEDEIVLTPGTAKYKSIVAQQFSTKIDPIIDQEFTRRSVDAISQSVELVYLTDESLGEIGK